MRTAQRGVTYLWVLLAIFLIGLLLGQCLDYYSHERQREREAEMLYVGNLYRDAIRAYYEASPGYRKEYPGSLHDLLADKRHLSLHRYLRQLYPDPLTGAPWQIIPAPGGGIMGVYSSGQGEPIKRAGFPVVYADFERARQYADWRFQFVPSTAVTPR